MQLYFVNMQKLKVNKCIKIVYKQLYNARIFRAQESNVFGWKTKVGKCEQFVDRFSRL